LSFPGEFLLRSHRFHIGIQKVDPQGAEEAVFHEWERLVYISDKTEKKPGMI